MVQYGPQFEIKDIAEGEFLTFSGSLTPYDVVPILAEDGKMVSCDLGELDLPITMQDVLT